MRKRRPHFCVASASSDAVTRPPSQEGDVISPTQPFSVEMPHLGGAVVTEADMWGAAPFDQLACRIAFRTLRYEGLYTPMVQGQRTLICPGFYSPLGVPCHRPPWGTLSAVDLETGKLVWQRPLGPVQDSVLPNGLKVPLAMLIGMPTLGGPLTTSGGLTFYAGTQDFYLRAIDTATGDEVWKGRMPVGARATPMTYMGKDGNQYLLIAAGGARQSPQRGDYVVAYRLRK